MNETHIVSMDTEAPEHEVILFKTEDNKIILEVIRGAESVWLNQKQLAELYQVGVNTISYHIAQIYADEELSAEATVRNYRIVQTEANRRVTRNVDFYDLEMILAIGYRVRSSRGVQFRQWATERLSEYVVKGFVLDDERLKGNNALVDYFDELLDRIRDIRASEKRAYLRVREIFALATDYNPQSDMAKTFFATMQNKMHYAATGQTAAELIATRANADEANMGLTNWKGSVVRKRDVVTAKNYLDAQEIDILNRIVNIFLEQAELKVLRKQQLFTADWALYLNKFLHDNELPILDGAGSISHAQARALAEESYDSFEQRRRAEKEHEAEAKYLEDLNQTSKLVAARRKKK
ncbi:MAG: virulence RhuM family protein [Candidatus Cloacimonetes bacterium]|nr:virulence RhuM family protein [Candidatus Cloacimonadota bacterium]